MLKIKTKKEFILFGHALMIGRILTSFKTPTYGDMQRIDGLMKTIRKIEENQQEHTQKKVKELGILESEIVDSSHPLYFQLSNSIYNEQSSVNRTALQVFTLNQLNASIEGLSITYNDRKLLHYWLVAEEKKD